MLVVLGGRKTCLMDFNPGTVGWAGQLSISNLLSLDGHLVVYLLHPSGEDLRIHSGLLIVVVVSGQTVWVNAFKAPGLGTLANNEEGKLFCARHVSTRKHCNTFFTSFPSRACFPLLDERFIWLKFPEETCFITVVGVIWVVIF